MIKTEIFMYQGTMLAPAINDFIAKNDVEYVDLKLTTNNNNLLIAVLIYKDGGQDDPTE